MSFDTRSFKAQEVTLTFLDVPIDSGYDDGEFCRIVAAADTFIDKVGTDGEVTRSESNDRRADVEIKLMQSSKHNLFLSNALRNKLTGPFFLRDRQGESISKGTKAWVKKLPEQGWAREAGARVWTLRVAHLDATIGGNILL